MMHVRMYDMLMIHAFFLYSTSVWAVEKSFRVSGASPSWTACHFFRIPSLAAALMFTYKIAVYKTSAKFIDGEK